MATTNFSWTLPTEGGDAGVWDTTLNAAFDSVDSDLFIVKTTADAALPLAGGTMTGEVEIHSAAHVVVNQGATMTGTETLDLSTGHTFYGTMTGNVTTFSISNWTASKSQVVTFEITNGGAFTWTWPAAIVWDGDTDPTFQSSGVDEVVFTSRDGGTTIRGRHSYSATS